VNIFTNNSLKTCISLRLYTAATYCLIIINSYLRYDGGNSCRQNTVTVSPCKLCMEAVRRGRRRRCHCCCSCNRWSSLPDCRLLADIRGAEPTNNFHPIRVNEMEAAVAKPRAAGHLLTRTHAPFARLQAQIVTQPVAVNLQTRSASAPRRNFKINYLLEAQRSTRCVVQLVFVAKAVWPSRCHARISYSDYDGDDDGVLHRNERSLRSLSRAFRKHIALRWKKNKHEGKGNNIKTNIIGLLKEFAL